MTDIELLVKKFDNIFPVRTIKMNFKNSDGTIEERTFLDVDYKEGDRIRSTMTPAEIERQRSVL